MHWGVHGKYGEQIYFRGKEMDIFQHCFVCFCWKAALEFTKSHTASESHSNISSMMGLA